MPRLSAKATLGAMMLLASAFCGSVLPLAASAQVGAVTEQTKALLWGIYAKRPDLQAAFGADGVAVPAMKARGLASLEEWASRWGFNEYPALLAPYATVFPVAGAPVPQVAGATSTASATPRALKVRSAAEVPVKIGTATFAPKIFAAKSLLVIDDATRKVLLSRNAQAKWPIASLSKLMTALVSIDNGVNMNATSTIITADEVGGARLRVTNGTQLTVKQIFDSMLVGSANNAANAMARTTGLTKPQFVAAMNARSVKMGMPLTTFVDPSGIETENVSTAEGIAALALEAFDMPDIKRATTTGQFTLVAAKDTHTITNTNWLLTDPNNGLYVMGGKTGYLDESGWNFVVKMKDARNRPVLVVVFGSGSRQQSFNDATAAAKWVWANYRWQKP